MGPFRIFVKCSADGHGCGINFSFACSIIRLDSCIGFNFCW